MINKVLNSVQSTVRLLLVLGALVLVNVLVSFVNLRLDLTEEQRYSLHPNTRALMNN